MRKRTTIKSFRSTIYVDEVQSLWKEQPAERRAKERFSAASRLLSDADEDFSKSEGLKMFFDWFPFIRPSQARLCFCSLSPSALDEFIITRYRKHTRSPNMQLYSSARVYFHENVSCLSSAINANHPLHKLLQRKCFADCVSTITALS